jgi:hypothetical protein
VGGDVMTIDEQLEKYHKLTAYYYGLYLNTEDPEHGKQYTKYLTLFNKLKKEAKTIDSKY